MPDHSYWLRPKPEAGERRGECGANARAGVGQGGESEESRDLIQKEKESSERALLSTHGKWMERALMEERDVLKKCLTLKKEGEKSDFYSNTAITAYFQHRTKPVCLSRRVQQRNIKV